MRRTPAHPVNPYIRNTFAGDLYLNLKRRDSFHWFRRILEHVLCMEISCPIPHRLYIPHPYGILAGLNSKIGEAVTLMHFCFLGPPDPLCHVNTLAPIQPPPTHDAYV